MLSKTWYLPYVKKNTGRRYPKHEKGTYTTSFAWNYRKVRVNRNNPSMFFTKTPPAWAKGFFITIKDDLFTVSRLYNCG